MHIPILSNCTNVDTNLRELFRREAFNICVGNSDDHFRNHGFHYYPLRIYPLV